jgi:FtsZ-binding cell division protein ZapB
MSTQEQSLGQTMSASEIVMMQIEIRELREKVIKLEQEKFLLDDQNKSLRALLDNTK